VKARPRAWLSFAALLFSGCMATSESTGLPLRPSDAGTRDAFGLRDTGTRDIGTFLGDATTDGGLPAYTWSEHVRPIVRAKCSDRCHGMTPAEDAPMSIVTYADTQADAPRLVIPVFQAMALRVQDRVNPMPPGPDHPVEPTPDPLTEEEIEIIRIWALLGGAEGEPEDAGVLD
jgi:hypothetical protein